MLEPNIKLKSAPKPLLKGAKLLRLYLKVTNQSIRKFCRLQNFDRVHIQRIIKGERRRINIDLADDIERATQFCVPIESWRIHPRKTKVSSMDLLERLWRRRFSNPQLPNLTAQREQKTLSA